MLQSASETTGNSTFHAELRRYVPSEVWSDSEPGDGQSDENRNSPGFANAQPAAVAGETPDLAFAREYCRQLAHRHYENFTVVSFLLPRRFRQDFCNIYAFCRWSDDLADEVDGGQLSLRLLDWWEQEFLRSQTAPVNHPVLLALRDTISERNLPTEPFTDLLRAFRQDQRQQRYRSDLELAEYCRYSANPVGRILLGLANSLSAETGPLSDSICTGLQLANFCQDMARDAAMGRIYAPQQRWEKHGVCESMILAARVTPQLQSMLEEWVEDTEYYFRRGWKLVDQIPGWLATDVDLFVRGGLAILQQIKKAQYDVWTQRPEVSKAKKLSLFAQSQLRRLGLPFLRSRTNVHTAFEAAPQRGEHE